MFIQMIELISYVKNVSEILKQTSMSSQSIYNSKILVSFRHVSYCSSRIWISFNSFFQFYLYIFINSYVPLTCFTIYLFLYCINYRTYHSIPYYQVQVVFIQECIHLLMLSLEAGELDYYLLEFILQL